MDLNELQSVRDRERQTDKLQQLRESFYADAGEFIQQLRAERDRAVERADDPFDSPEVRQLSDEIKTAQQTVEAIYEKRVGKIVKAASFAAADLPAEVDGMTAEEQALFENLVGNIEDNRDHVLTLLDGDEPPRQGSAESGSRTTGSADPPRGAESRGQPSSDRTGGSHEPAQTDDADEDVPAGWDDETGSEGVTAADVMGGDTGPPEEASPRETDTDQPSGGTEPTPAQNTGESSPPADESGPAGEYESAPPSSEPVDPPVRKDGGQDTATQENQPGATDQDPTPAMERQRVQMLEDVETFLGFDERDYDLDADDVVTLPATNADILLERGVAREL
jgi:DNA replication factor GINS